MSTLTDYTQDEVEKLMAAPMLVSMYVMGSSLSGPVGLVREMMAGVETVLEAGKDTAGGGLFSELWSEQNVREQENKVQSEAKASTMGAEDMSQAQAKMLAEVKSAVEIISSKGTADESTAYRQLIVRVAEQVANAAKEGGLMGIGGELVNKAEQDAIGQIRTAVGMS